MRMIASRGDVYGPGAGNTVRTLEFGGAPASDTVQSPQGAVPVTTVFSNLKGSVIAQPITWLIGLVLALVAYKLVEEKRGGQEAFEEIKIGLNNVVKVGLMAMLFFVIAKYGASRVDIPGASSFVKYATGSGN